MRTPVKRFSGRLTRLLGRRGADSRQLGITERTDYVQGAAKQEIVFLIWVFSTQMSLQVGSI